MPIYVKNNLYIIVYFFFIYKKDKIWFQLGNMIRL